ncbi:MAG: nucleotidyltransferase domain-containing protein [Oscillospiraceae bacterium]|nr:nucleotidyltransferase domain-containing protein [Oscillospiraceae bacterium]
MIDIDRYLRELEALLEEQFGERLVYLGLQGSYLRGEATEQSDIDVMAVIDGLGPADLDRYRAAIRALPYADRSCGFLCGRADLANWPPMEICHLLHSTRDCRGTLRELVPAWTERDLRNYVKQSVGDLFHEICHRAVHAGPERSAAALPGAYKRVFYILQDLHFLRRGVWAATKAELLPLLEGKDRAVLARAMALSAGEAPDAADSFALLFAWCQETLATT